MHGVVDIHSDPPDFGIREGADARMVKEWPRFGNRWRYILGRNSSQKRSRTCGKHAFRPRAVE